MRKLSLIIALFVAVMFQAGAAQAFTSTFYADGNLTEWGVTPGAFNSTNWTPAAGIVGTYGVEDQNGNINYYLNPGYGGQAFDAEAMYAAYDSTNLYFAIVTGKTPGITNGWRPGDIAFDFGKNGSYEYGIETVTDPLTNDRTAGSLYSANTWAPGLWPTTEDDQTEMTAVNGNSLGSAPLAYNNTYYGKDAHYVIEGSIARSYFGSAWGQSFTMSWTQTCGNDVIKLNVTPTPEPATMALFGIGLAGLGVLRRRQFKA